MPRPTCTELARMNLGDEPVRRAPVPPNTETIAMDQDQVIIRQLVTEMIESGRTPEDVCADHPHLVGEVRRLWQCVRAVQGELDAIFPSSDAAMSGEPGPALDRTLPQIPGYDIEAVLGRGGMGVVYRARHAALNRTVAIKMPLAGPFASAAERHRHMREAQAVAALRHPNIITVHDVGEVEGRPYFTMEFIEGQDLGTKLSNIPQPARDAAALVATLADATECAHRAGIIHRDLKPANVLIAPDGAPKIADFGLARHFGADATLTAGGFHFGTPSYMSPEQARGQPTAPSASADIYSLGAILYEMLTGRPPFRAESTVETLRQVLEEDPAPPARLNPKVPRDLESVCLMCLRKEPQRRYSSARALADDLQRFLKGEPTRARPLSSIERLYKSVRRRPARAVGGLGAAATIAAVLGAVLWTASQRTAVHRAVAEDLTEAVRLQETSNWQASRSTLERAKARLAAVDGSTDGPLTLRAAGIERDLDLVDRLKAMRLERGASREAESDGGISWQAYRDVFMRAGLLHDADGGPQFGARVAASPVRAALIDAMDDWSICAAKTDQLEWLLAATRTADPGSPWRQRARDIGVWKDASAMAELARQAPIESEPVSLLLIVAGRLFEWDADAGMRLLRKIQAAHPADFWTNLALGYVLSDRKDADAIGFFRAAIASEPEAFTAHFSLAMALDDHQRTGESIDAYLKALALDPKHWVPHFNVSRLLTEAGRHDESIEHARAAVRLAPQEPLAHLALGRALQHAGRNAEAIPVLRRAAELAPKDSGMRAGLLADVERLEAAAASTPPNR